MEAETLPKLVERIEAALEGIDFEIVVIDDNSPDGTALVAEKLKEKFGNIKVIRRPEKLGLGSAIVDGLKVAGAKLVAIMDADLQHPPEVLAYMFKKLKDGYDIVVASRYVEGGGAEGLGLWRRLVSRVATILGKISLPRVGSVADPLSGYFAFNRSVIDEVKLNPVGYKILLEILAKGRYESVCEVPYSFQRRAEGKSKLGPYEMLRYLKHLFELMIDTGEYRRMIKFVLVGLVGILVNEGVLWFLTECMSFYYVLSAAVGCELSILSNFAMNEMFTFRDLATNLSTKSVFRRAFEYNWTRILGIFLDLITLYVLTTFLGLHYLLANLVGIAVGLAWGYATSVAIVWRR